MFCMSFNLSVNIKGYKNKLEKRGNEIKMSCMKIE